MFIFQFLNDKMHNYVLFNAFVRFIIQQLKNKHTFLKTEKAKFSQWENLVFSVLRRVSLLFNFLMLKFLVMFVFDIIVHFIIEQLKYKYTFLKKSRNWES